MMRKAILIECDKSKCDTKAEFELLVDAHKNKWIKITLNDRVERWLCPSHSINVKELFT